MKAGWQRKTLREAFATMTGGTPPKSDAELYGDYLPFVKPPELRDAAVGSAEDGLSEAGAAVARTLPPNSILVSCIGNLGKIGLNAVPVAFNQQINAILPDVSKALPWFMFYQTLSCAFKDQLESRASGTTVPIVNKSKFNSIEIILPPLPEQRRIVAILDEAFGGIATAKANAEKNLKNARALFEGVLDSIQGENAPLGNYVSIKTGKIDANAATENGAYPFFTCAKEIYAIDNYAFDLEAILLAGNNAVGEFNVKHYNGKFNAYQRTYVITVVDERRLSYRFLYFQILKSLRRFKEQSVGAGTKFLKLGMIKDLEISLPLIAKQIEIASMLDSLLDETKWLESIYQQKLTALNDLKKSLLHEAFSGKL